MSDKARRIITIFRNMRAVLSDPERKSMARMCLEFFRCCFAARCIAIYYFTSFLYRRQVHNILDYMSEKEAKRVQDKINDRMLANLVSNKLFFLEHFSRAGLPVPRLLGYNMLDGLYLNKRGAWQVVELSCEQVFQEALEGLMDSWGVVDVFLKLIRGSQGIGALKVTREQLAMPAEIRSLYSAVTKTSYVIMEVVQQHPDLSRLNPGALNTMRIDTFRAPGKKPKILSAFLRVGGEGNYVDNVSAGGVFVGINLDNGTLKPVARNFFHGSQHFGTFRANPLNGVVFEGFLIPMFEEVKQVLIQASSCLAPSLIGWDIGVSDRGPVLIEGNVLYYGVISSEIAYGGYGQHPVWKEVVAYANKKDS